VTDHAEAPVSTVAVAYVHQDEVLYSWHHSLIQLLDHDLANSARIWSGGFIAMRCGTDGLAEARNSAVREFLKDSKADWLWWIDTDMGFMPDTVDRLLEAADPAERPVMGALCFANREVDNDGMGGRRALAAPVIMHWTHDGAEAGFDTRWDYPLNSVVRCDGIGAACVLIHRSVFEQVAERFGPNWYTRTVNPSTGEMISEDLAFCARMMALQIPVHVHTGVPTTHAKRFWLAEEDYWRQRALNPPPVTVEQRDADREAKRDWTVPRYAIIPTHNRPELLTALVTSLGRQCDRIVVLDNASEPAVDEEQLQTAAGVPVLVLRDEEQPPHLSRYWNVMLDAVAESADSDVYDVAILNDDSVMPAGWYDACATPLREHETAVIAHTTPTTPALLTELHNRPNNRMTPHAFVIRGELGHRADESMRWWYFDTDLDLRARQAGGVLSVPGPQVVNSRANSTTVGLLAGQAQADHGAFAAKWSR
jgi:GT2 family glycosyltransferase